MQLIVEPDAKQPSKSFDFNMILSHAVMQFSKVSAYFYAKKIQFIRQANFDLERFFCICAL